jgi:hypothetical protein
MIIYSLITRNKFIVAEFTDYNGEFINMAKNIVNLDENKNNK